MHTTELMKLVGTTKAGKLQKIRNLSSRAHGQTVETAPSPEQAKAENYRKAHIRIDGMSIAIENPDRTYRQGVDPAGKKWRNKIYGDYGYIKGSMGYDKDSVDIFLAPGYKGGAEVVYVINQITPKTGKFDEHKCVVGVDSLKEAEELYLSNYAKGWKGLDSVVAMAMPDFKKWVRSRAPSKGPAPKQGGWIGVDLDGTLAKSDGEFCEESIGDPVPKMVSRVKAWVAAGQEVRIMTARAHDMTGKTKRLIEAWCGKHIGTQLPITNEKDPGMTALWDDRAVTVAKNRGYATKAAAKIILDKKGNPYSLEVCEREDKNTLHYKLRDDNGKLASEVKIHSSWRPKTKYLYYWHTDPDYRGKGVGAALLDHVLAVYDDTVITLGVGSFHKVGADGYVDHHSDEEDSVLRKIYSSRGFVEQPGSKYLIKYPEDENGVKAAAAISIEELERIDDFVKTAVEANKPYEGSFTGPEAVHAALETLDLDVANAEALAVIKSGKKTARPRAVKVLNLIEGLKRNEVQPHELMIRKVPIIPPAFRPFAAQGDTFIAGDANELYQDLFKMNKAYKAEELAFGAPMADTAANLHGAVRAVYGFGDPVEPKTKDRGAVGFMKKLAGNGSSKYSYIQRKMLSKTQDNVGRSTIIPDPELDMDEVGVPEDLAWEMYKPYIHRGLVRKGVALENAILATDERSDEARKVLVDEMKTRPTIYSRAPSWHRFNIVAGRPKLVKGKAIRISPFVTEGHNADFDGDQMNLHVPSLPDAVEEAYEKLMPSKMLFSIRDPDRVVPKPKHEQVLGLYMAQKNPAKATHQFKTKEQALDAIRSGKVRMSDEIEIG